MARGPHPEDKEIFGILRRGTKTDIKIDGEE
jgi:hypothetical protein